jgi:hypothetical protein
MKNVFVLGLDDFNLAIMRKIPQAADCRFHQLLTIDELRHGESIPIAELVDKATQELESFDGSIDAIIGYWDFPVTLMVPVLCGRFSLRSPTLESVLKCEHKYWSRLEQRQAITEHPAFTVVDPHDPPTGLPDGLSYPVWLKPVKSQSSMSAYHVSSDEELARALEAERREIGRIGKAFEYFLDLATLPPDIAQLGGQVCLIEEEAPGAQVTVEGFSKDGRIEIYSIVDSITYEQRSSFLRYQYPSSLSDSVTQRLVDVSKRIIGHIGLDHWTFNIEYFWDPTLERLTLLEINPRHSQSHAQLTYLVDGLPNHACMIDLALGREPHIPHREGRYNIAAKWFPRRFADSKVVRVPSKAEISRVERDIPGTSVEVIVEPGEQLSDLADQDSYSFGLANIYIGAEDEGELQEKYHQCMNGLPFEFVDRTGYAFDERG